jgi:FkbM family methyltransferase
MNITDQVILNDSGFTWPKNGTYTWEALNRETDHISHIRPYLRNTNVMVQAGGNCGLVVKPFADIFKQIYTFEPDPVNFYCLNLNLPFTNVNKIQACLGHMHEMVDLANPFTDDVGGYHVAPGTVIPTLKIDDLELVECDLIMLDMEGYEFNALKGGEETIKKHRPILCVEIFDQWLGRFNTTPTEVVEYITNVLGYTQVAGYSSDYIYAPK